jgi:hypothetical protein
MVLAWAPNHYYQQSIQTNEIVERRKTPQQQKPKPISSTNITGFSRGTIVFNGGN